MALAWSVLSVGQGPTSTVQLVFRGSGFCAAEAARSLLLAWLCDGTAAAGSCLVGAVTSGSAGRGGSFSPRAACTGSIGTVFEIGRPPFPAHKATPAQPSNVRTTAHATKGMTSLRVPFPSPEAVAMRLLSLCPNSDCGRYWGPRPPSTVPKPTTSTMGGLLGPPTGAEVMATSSNLLVFCAAAAGATPCWTTATS